MDDLIVIILTLIIAVVGVLGQLKKRKAATQNNQQQNNTGGFWNLLENEMKITEQPQEQYYEEEAEEEAEILAETESLETKKEYQFAPEDEGMSIYKIDSVDEILENEQSEPEKVKKSSVQFSLRKAVIFSEILNRKYE